MITNLHKEAYGYSAKTTVSLLAKPQEITLFFDEALGILQDNSAIIAKLTTFLEREINFANLLNEVSREVANICFSQSSQAPSQQEIAEFAKDISILKLNIFAEDMVFYFLAPKFLSNMVITCQLDFNGEIENLELVEERFITFEKMLDKS